MLAMDDRAVVDIWDILSRIFRISPGMGVGCLAISDLISMLPAFTQAGVRHLDWKVRNTCEARRRCTCMSNTSPNSTYPRCWKHEDAAAFQVDLRSDTLTKRCSSSCRFSSFFASRSFCLRTASLCSSIAFFCSGDNFDAVCSTALY